MDINQTIRLLGGLLGRVISEQESPDLLEKEEFIRNTAKSRRNGKSDSASQLKNIIEKLDINQAQVIATAFTIYLELNNLAEEMNEIETVHENKNNLYPKYPEHSIQKTIEIMKTRGMTFDEMKQLIDSLEIEMVFTAHPTEAKRRTLISKLQSINGLLHSYQHVLQPEKDHILDKILSEITSIWLINRVRTKCPAVTDEVRTGLYFISSVLWGVIPKLYDELNKALETHYPGLKISVDNPWLKLASWIGGDRDGNPNVTFDVTAETLRLHRGLALRQHKSAFQSLGRNLGISSKRFNMSPKLIKWVNNRKGNSPEAVQYLFDRYPDEVIRQAFSLLSHDLSMALEDDMVSRLLSDKPHNALVNLEQFLTPFMWIKESLPKAISSNLLDPVLTQLSVFKLNGARLDIRQDSDCINDALGEILRALNITNQFESLTELNRYNLLTKLLREPSPAIGIHAGVTAETVELWALFQLIKRGESIYGQDIFGPFIISMTRGPSDILAVLLLARWAGCDKGRDIVPLFETVNDLNQAPDILDKLFSIEEYGKHLKTCKSKQMVMIGYSDSSKDKGYLGSNWALYQAQDEIAQICRKNNIVLSLFHGRGGSVARGGGPAYRAILSQPPGTVAGKFRVTEQGEIIAARYSDANHAFHHMEQVISAVLLSSMKPSKFKFPEIWSKSMDDMAKLSSQVYKKLVYDSPGFFEFWNEVTPLDVISQLHISSRPSKRKKGMLDVSNIRAIPWVFSWMQSRFNLPGWFGVGTGLKGIKSTEQLQDMYQKWPFFKAVMDNTEMSLLKADMEIAHQYVALCSDKIQAEGFYSIIKEEYECTKELLSIITGHKQLMDSDPDLQYAIRMRDPYIDPLNYLQVELLKRYRSLKNRKTKEGETLFDILVLTINGIASGLRNTG